MGYGMDDECWGEHAANEDFGIAQHDIIHTPIIKKPTRGAKVQVKCLHCNVEFTARVADRKRGWAKFCSKVCKGKKQMGVKLK